MTNDYSVDIVQEYVPHYRVPFFEALSQQALERNIKIRVLAGAPQGELAGRSDEGKLGNLTAVSQREMKIFNRRINLRYTLPLTRHSDLVVVEQARRNVDVYLSLLRRRPPVAMWGHGRDFIGQPSAMDRLLLKALTSRARWFFGYTQQSVDAVVEAGFSADRTTVLWNTTDTSALRRNLAEVSKEDIVETRRSFSHAKHVALFVGGLDESKRLPFLINACDEIARNLDGFRLVIAGEGTAGTLVTEAATTRPWLTATGALRGLGLARALASADVLLMPGRVGLVAVDALVAELPVVTTDWHGHAPERAYLNAENAVVTTDDPHVYAQEVTRLLKSPERLSDLRRGCGRSAPFLSTESMASRFLDGLEAIRGAS